MDNNSKEHISKYVSQIYRKGNSFISKKLSQYEIGSGQIMFLIQLYKKDGISQEELSENLNIDKGTTARAIKKLEEENFLVRLRDQQDKRAYKIYLTDKSKEIKEHVCEVLQEWDTIISKNITKEERDILVSLLKKICINQNIK